MQLPATGTGARRRLIWAMAICAASALSALLSVGAGASGGDRQAPARGGHKHHHWHYQRARTPHGTKPQPILEGDDKKGAASIVDLAVRPSKERYRTSKGGHRRVWQVRGTLAADFGKGDDHRLQKVACSETARGSKAATSPKNNVRLMYPRQVNRLKRVYHYSQPSFSLKGLGVTLPDVQSVFYEADRKLRPSVSWKTLRDNRHRWKWLMDAEPRSANFRFIAHWVGPDKKFRFRVNCKVKGIDRQALQPDDHSGVSFAIHRTVHARH